MSLVHSRTADGIANWLRNFGKQCDHMDSQDLPEAQNFLQMIFLLDEKNKEDQRHEGVCPKSLSMLVTHIPSTQHRTCPILGLLLNVCE